MTNDQRCGLCRHWKQFKTVRQTGMCEFPVPSSVTRKDEFMDASDGADCPRSLDHDPPHPSPRGGLIPLISFDPPGHGSQCRRDKSSLDMAIGHLPQQPSG